MSKHVVQAVDGRPHQSALSPAIRAGGFVFVAGQPPYSPDAWGQVVAGGIEEQTRQVMRNTAAVLDAAGLSLDDVVSVTAYLRDIDQDFPVFTRIYEEFFPGMKPTRMTLGCVLPRGMLVEVQCTAVARTAPVD
jgi:2-iminobutanoate/2-iminopropanoate deaminase